MSSIPYRAIPISLEDDPRWLKLSLKRRALFLFMCRKSVSKKLHVYKGIELTFGEYSWSYQVLADQFNETVCPDDQFSKTGCHKAVENFIEIGFVKIEKIGSGVRSQTIIKIIHSDTYDLIKSQWCTNNEEQCTNGERSNESNGERSEDKEKRAETISKSLNEVFKKQTGERIENIVNIGVVNDQQEYTESTLKTLFREDNVRTVPSSKEDQTQDGVNAPPKYKLNAVQMVSYKWLYAQGIDTSPDTLSWWAKTYDLKRLKDVHKAAVMVKPQKNKKNSIGALMNNFLKKDIPVETDFRRQNEEFIHGFVDREPDMNWKIEKKFVTCEIKGIPKEVFFDIHPQSFVDQLIMLENQFKESRA